MSQKIIVTIPKSGLAEGKKSVEVKADGFSGSGCSLQTGKYMKALGGNIENEEYLPEYYAEGPSIDNEVSQNE